MLYRLEVENFYSIRDRQVIDLRVARNTPDEPEKLAPIWPGAAERAPRVAAFFGPNASGKSNILKALPFLAWFLKSSFQAAPDAQMPYIQFLDEAKREQPTKLSFSFAGPTDLSQKSKPDAAGCDYVYEVTTINSEALPQRILREALTYRPPGASRRVRLFERDQNGHVRAGKAFDLAGYDQALAKILRPNASVISTLAQLNHALSTDLANIAAPVRSNILTIKSDSSDSVVIQHYASNPPHLKLLNRDLARLDLGIKAMHVQQGINGPVLLFEHIGLAHLLPQPLESNGTWQFIKLFPHLISTLDTGGIAVIDELDQAIHPFVLSEILRWFGDRKRNPNNAQLWASCQNPSLLDDLSKDEIFLCEKDLTGGTRVYGVRDIQSVRRDDNYYRKYLGGVYGAVPHVA